MPDLNLSYRKRPMKANLERSSKFETEQRSWLFTISQLIFTLDFIFQEQNLHHMVTWQYHLEFGRLQRSPFQKTQPLTNDYRKLDSFKLLQCNLNYLGFSGSHQGSSLSPAMFSFLWRSEDVSSLIVICWMRANGLGLQHLNHWPVKLVYQLTRKIKQPKVKRVLLVSFFT